MELEGLRVDAHSAFCASADAVISNGVFDLSADKPAVFREVARL